MRTPKRIHMTSRFMPNPPNCKRVTRGSRWGNPYKVGETYDDEGHIEDNAAAVAAFRRYLDRNPDLRNRVPGTCARGFVIRRCHRCIPYAIYATLR